MTSAARRPVLHFVRRLGHLVTGTVPRGYHHGRYLGTMSKQYLILIEQLVREGRSEREIDRIVREVVSDDDRTERADAPEDAEPAHLRAA
jgi:hypothetical protein